MQLSDEEERRFKYERFISSKIPCVIFSTMTDDSGTRKFWSCAIIINVPAFAVRQIDFRFHG